MEQVNFKGENGFYDEKTGFIPLSSLEQVNLKGQNGYYNEKVGFIPKQGTQEIPPIKETKHTPEWMGKHPTLAGIYGATKETLFPIAEGVALTAGDIAGIVNPATGAALGAGSYAAVKAGKRGVESLAGERPPSTASEELTQQGKDLMSGAEMMTAGNIVGKVATEGVNKVLAPAAKKIQEGVGKLIEKFKYPATPADITQSKTMSILEGLLGYKPISGDVMFKKNNEKLASMMKIREELINKDASSQTVEQLGKNIKKEVQTILSKYTNAKDAEISSMADSFLNKYGSLSKTEGGEQFVSAMSNDLKTRNEKITSLYNQAKELLPQKGKDIVPLSNNIQNTANELLNEELSKAPAQQNSKIIKTLEDFMPTNSMTWNGIDKTRGQLLENRRGILKATGGKETAESRVYSMLSEGLDNEMAAFAEGKGSNVKTVLEKAREASRTMHELYDKDIMGIMNKSPEDIVDRIANKGEVTLIKQIKDTLGESGLDPIRKSFFQKTINGATGQNGVIDGKKLNKVISSYGDTIDQLLLPEQSSMLKAIGDRGIFINEKIAGMKTVDFLETLSGSSNENIVNAIIKPKNTELVKTAKRLLDGSKISELKSQTIEKILKVSGNGSYLPISSAKEFIKYEAPLKELLNPTEYQNIKDFIKLGQNANKVEQLAINASQTGQVMMGNEVFNKILTAPRQIGYTLGIPYIVSKIYTSRLAMKYMLQATQLPATSQQAISLFSKAMMVSAKSNSDPFGIKGEAQP